VTAQLTLQPQSSAAGIARRWVREMLTERSRDDLMDAAVLGVSELVTNALLHVRSVINVRIIDAEPRLRIEVYDDSTRPPEGNASFVDEETSPPTIGRGLRIVDAISLSWGVAYENAGKCVWFQPKPEGEQASGQAVDDPEPEPVPALPGDSGPESVGVDLVDLPVDVLLHYRVRFGDLRRELTLIALQAGHHEDDPRRVGSRLNELLLRLESFGPIGESARKLVAEAHRAGQDRVTVHYDMPLAALPVIEELRSLLMEADAYCRSEALLTLAAGPQEAALRAWYLGELLNQARGADPTPWPGAFTVTDPDPLD
jgi:anti-sigma regulatory factor (Ser/Thr protein kinase)